NGPDFYPNRPPLSQSSSYRASRVRVSSPLRLQLDDDARPKSSRATSTSFMGYLSPPDSPVAGSSVMARERPNKGRSITDSGLWSSSQHRDFPSPPSSPSMDTRRSGLWGESTPPSPKADVPNLVLPESSAPKFSRSALKKSSVIMPVAAPKLKSRGSSASLSSIASSSSSRSTIRSSTLPRDASQDRLSTLAETSRAELGRDGGLLASNLPLPRPAFMRKNSNSSSTSSTPSLRSNDSVTSLSSLQSFVEEDAVEEEPLQISCTKSDGDAEGSVESSSVKSGAGKASKRGGLFRRFTKVLKLDKKSQDRRGSL
ncbi:hypothetical protein P7C73_g6182, partial [Tremellales sp. Uapishka_1]